MPFVAAEAAWSASVGDDAAFSAIGLADAETIPQMRNAVNALSMNKGYHGGSAERARMLAQWLTLAKRLMLAKWLILAQWLIPPRWLIPARWLMPVHSRTRTASFQLANPSLNGGEPASGMLTAHYLNACLPAEPVDCGLVCDAQSPEMMGTRAQTLRQVKVKEVMLREIR